ncbi:serine/threonine-protein kinase [Actinomadura sp. B10D3]|uniref:serine/threonine-protein kinase n=1 Tax=Actinomadura sp. B10D3 TaxID=3153557 RepID=UPI00325EF675
MAGAGLGSLKATDPAEVGPYRLLARLGAGGMGQVYLGRSPGRRLVAVKVVHPHFADNAMFRRRFTKEVAAARRIGGFYTAQVIDADPDADPPWLATEYIAGPSLQDAIDTNGALPEVSVAALGAGLAEGLLAVHDQNVIHRDLKPGNVLLAQDGPRIIDFGIARATDATSQSMTMVGTPGYMSPEQYQGRGVGPASDVFCLAAVLVFAATGRHPFGEGPPDALGYRVRHEEPDLTGVPASLLPLVAAGLEKDPDDRPPAQEFLDRCSALSADEGMTLPAKFSRMIATRVAETEVFARDTGGGKKSPPRSSSGDRAQRPKSGDRAKQAKSGDRAAQRSPRPPKSPQRPPQPPKKSTQPKPNAAVIAGVVGVLLVALLIGLANNDSGGSSANAGSTSSPSATPETSSTTSEPSSTPSSSPTPDPTFEAFDAITVGDCLDAHKDPYDSDEWSEDEPNSVPCGSGDAYVKVFGIEDSASGCDYEPLDGESYWRSPVHDGEAIYLCVRRQFREGECFLGFEKSGEAGRVFINGHGLMTSWGCGKSTVPKGFDYILKFTGYYATRCPEGSRKWSDFRQGVLCARVV